MPLDRWSRSHPSHRRIDFQRDNSNAHSEDGTWDAIFGCKRQRCCSGYAQSPKYVYREPFLAVRGLMQIANIQSSRLRDWWNHTRNNATKQPHKIQQLKALG